MIDPGRPVENKETPKSEGPAEARTDKPAPPPRSDPSTPADRDTVEADVDESKLRQEASTINNIFGLYTESVSFATMFERLRATSTDGIEPDVVAGALRLFCRSDVFDRAAAVLAKHGMVVLVGSEGSGRYMAAVALLSGWPGMVLNGPITSFAPSMSVAELARKDFLRARRSYLVHEMLGDGRASAEIRFEISRLREVLRSTGARLVITADARAVSHSDFGELVITWSPPDGGEVFDLQFGGSDVKLSDRDVARARAHAAGLAGPRDVVNFVARLAEGVDAAMHSQSDEDRRAVKTWYDDRDRKLEEQLMVAAAAFLDDVPERAFERCLSRLDQLVREFDPEHRAPSADRFRLEYKPWRASSAPEGLVLTIDGDGEPRVGFRSRFMRPHALDEIWSSYGYGLLQPLRLWIHELVQDVSIDVRAQTAIGLALLAERRWKEVKDSFLDPWSRGLAVFRYAAANTLSMMAASERLAPRALETAISWSDKQGPRRAMTAAMAFGGPLSLRYPSKTFEELWFLTTRGAQIAATARVALSLQLGLAEPGAGRAVTILRNTRSALEWTARNKGGLSRRNATSAVLTVLLCPSQDSDQLVIAGLLRTRPDTVDLIGFLVSDVLLSAPHFHDGVDLLRKVLVEVTNMDEGAALAARLGAAVFDCWPADALATLRPKLERDLGSNPDDVELSRQIVRSFIHGIAQ